MAALQWCGRPQNRQEFVKIVVGINDLNLPMEVLKPLDEGHYKMGDETPPISKFDYNQMYYKDPIGNVSYPDKSHIL
ncbi:MAG: hypothetical protein WBA13_00760 [Microcoleaceae cyanobacterium]